MSKTPQLSAVVFQTENFFTNDVRERLFLVHKQIRTKEDIVPGRPMVLHIPGALMSPAQVDLLTEASKVSDHVVVTQVNGDSVFASTTGMPPFIYRTSLGVNQGGAIINTSPDAASRKQLLTVDDAALLLYRG